MCVVVCGHVESETWRGRCGIALARARARDAGYRRSQELIHQERVAGRRATINGGAAAATDPNDQDLGFSDDDENLSDTDIPATGPQQSG